MLFNSHYDVTSAESCEQKFWSEKRFIRAIKMIDRRVRNDKLASFIMRVIQRANLFTGTIEQIKLINLNTIDASIRYVKLVQGMMQNVSNF